MKKAVRSPTGTSPDTTLEVEAGEVEVEEEDLAKGVEVDIAMIVAVEAATVVEAATTMEEATGITTEEEAATTMGVEMGITSVEDEAGITTREIEGAMVAEGTMALAVAGVGGIMMRGEADEAIKDKVWHLRMRPLTRKEEGRAVNNCIRGIRRSQEVKYRQSVVT